jgi:hypothetical protein
VPVVKIGGRKKVGHRKTPAGMLVWGSEHGGRTFAAASGGTYWITPAVTAYAAGPGQGVYLDAVRGILADVGIS